MRNLLLALLLVSNIAAAQIAGVKFSTCIDFKQVDVKLSASPITLVAKSAASLPVTFASKTPLICTVLGEIATLKSSGVCTIVAQTASTPNYLAGQAPWSFAVTAVIIPPPPPPPAPDPGAALSIKIINPKAGGAYAVGVPIALQTEITGAGITRVEIHNSCDANYFSTTVPPYATSWTPLAPAIGCRIYAEVTNDKGQGFARSDDVLINVSAGVPPPPPPTQSWSMQQAFFAACGPCPSTAKIETQTCPGYDIGLIDAAGASVSQNMRWVKL